MRRLWRRETPARDVASRRYEHGRLPTRFVDPLDDADLDRLNTLLPWHCFTVDSHGRPFGRQAWEGKRSEPQPVPDPRIVRFDSRFGLAGKDVLEIGCFEGVHTVALCALGARVTAVDARVENVVKTIVRCAFFGWHPTVFTCNVERPAQEELLGTALCHHVGVLYHLSDPVAHLRWLCPRIGEGLMLDTHYAWDDSAREVYTSGGDQFRFRPVREAGRDDPFSGTTDDSKWLLLDDIVSLLRNGGFGEVEVAERRDERNGPRVLLFAARTGR
ncbi:MAG: methyltransferase type 12 [Actinomycetota bacterium]|nr:methyltransferase type 12 [Actinomycetota bacterium]